MMDIGADLQRAFDEGYEKGKADRQQGEWIYQDDDVFAGEYYCDNCDSRAEVDLYGEWILSNYCPNCGAKMDGERKESE